MGKITKTYYRDDKQGVEISDEGVKGFNLFIVRIADPETGDIEETAWSLEQCKAYPCGDGVVRMSELDWLKAFEPHMVPEEPEPEPEPQPQPVAPVDLEQYRMSFTELIAPWIIVVIFSTVFWLLDRMFQ